VYPFIIEAEYGGHTMIIVNGSQTWRWDFWPLTSEAHHETFSFSRFLLSILWATLNENISDRLIVYPDTDNVNPGDSISFTVRMPVGIDRTDSLSLTLEIIGLEDTTAPESVFTFTHHADTLAAGIRIPPLPDSHYRYTAAIEGYDEYMFSDTLVIDSNNTELYSGDQNSVVLSQIGVPLPLDTARIKEAVFSLNRSAGTVTTPSQFRITHTWLLLIIILVALSGEWVVRRRFFLE
jgi:hypothetical protein